MQTICSVCTAYAHPTLCALLLLQEFGNRPGAFPRDPAKLVGERISNTFDMEGGPVIMRGRVTEFLIARITEQGMTPLCAPSRKPLHPLNAEMIPVHPLLMITEYCWQQPVNVWHTSHKSLVQHCSFRAAHMIRLRLPTQVGGGI